MFVTDSTIFKATQYNAIGDHPKEYIWSVSTPILDEEEGKRWPDSGRLGTLAECQPEDLRYAITGRIGPRNYFEIELGWWVLEFDDVPVAVYRDEDFLWRFKEVK